MVRGVATALLQELIGNNIVILQTSLFSTAATVLQWW